MCSDGWDYEDPESVGGVGSPTPANGECPECGESTLDGEAVRGCFHSPIQCEVCGSRPCDGSC